MNQYQQDYLNSLKDKSEKELLALQLLHQQDLNRKVERINNNVKFFFWFFIISLALVLATIVNISESLKHVARH